MGKGPRHTRELSTDNRMKETRIYIAALYATVMAFAAAATMALIVLALSGCAQFRTDQTDESTTSPEGIETRKVTTRATARTFAAGKQALSNWKASQTDKTQGASVGSVNQESDASALMGALSQGIGTAVVQAMTGRSAAPARSPVPPGFKLVPVDDHSTNRSEIE